MEFGKLEDAPFTFQQTSSLQLDTSLPNLLFKNSQSQRPTWQPSYRDLIRKKNATTWTCLCASSKKRQAGRGCTRTRTIPTPSSGSTNGTHGGPAAAAVPHGPNGRHRWRCSHRLRRGTHRRSRHDWTFQRRIQRDCRCSCCSASSRSGHRSCLLVGD